MAGRPPSRFNPRSYAEATAPRQTAKPVFIKEFDYFGLEKPTQEQYITHEELYAIIGSIIPAEQIAGIQRVRGLWRIYADDGDSRESLLAEGRLTLRDKSIPIYDRNPGSLYPGDNDLLRVRVKNIPLSADDGQIKRTINLHGCDVVNLYRERLRFQGRLTNCETGDRLVFVSDLQGPLPKSMQIGKYRALVLHQGQPDERKECSNCLRKGHNTRDCTSDIVCRSCHATGHVSSDCPMPLIDEADESEKECDSEVADQEEVMTLQEVNVAPLTTSQTITHVPQVPSSQQIKATTTATEPPKTQKSNAPQNGKTNKSTIPQFFKDKGTPQRKSSNIPHNVRSPPTPTEQIQTAAGKKPKEHKSKSK